MPSYQMEFPEEFVSAETDFIRESLRQFNLQFAPPDEHRPLNILLRAEDGRITGGLVGGTYWRWLHIDILWVDESLRGRGFGSQLLRTAETEAARRGCGYVHLETHDFQAPGFYARHGYRVFGELANLPPGARKIFLWKPLPDIRSVEPG
jgi:GNAT superfamily N-acetyltransferase